MIRSLLTAAALLLPSGAMAGTLGSFSEIVVFGDSLSDPDVPGLDPTLFPDGQVTNGNTWAAQLGFADAGVDNFAVAGARAGETDPGDLLSQVSQFIATGTALGSNALAAIYIGGNDIGDATALFDPFAAVNPANTRIEAALGGIAASIDALAAAGFDKALLFLSTDIGDTPRLQAFDAVVPGTAAVATGLTGAFNAGLLGIDAFLTQDITLGFVDLPTRLASVAADPVAAGFSNVDDACVLIDPGPPPAFLGFTPGCTPARDNGFLYYDSFHPTHQGHAIIADEMRSAASQIAPVPLPATGALLALGIGALALRRKRAAA